MKHKNIFKIIGLTALTFFMSACGVFQVDEVVNPNAPSVEGVLNNASKGQLQNLLTGLEDRHRLYMTGTSNLTAFYGSLGREVYAYYSSDPRFTDDWLGRAGITEAYPDFFASGRHFNSPYKAIKQSNILIQSVQNTGVLTNQEASGYIGFANMVKGFQYLIPLNGQYQNGIRIDVSETLNPGATLSYDAALAEIRKILDEANSQLGSAGGTFAFGLTAGFDGYDTPSGMQKVNHAIAARAALYAKDWSSVLTHLNASFMNLNGDLMAGPKHPFGNAPDTNNPLFYVKDTDSNPAPNTQILMVHPSMISDALAGDLRLNKFHLRANSVPPPTLPDPAFYQDNRYNSLTDPISFIRNEELILMYAEANAQIGNSSSAIDAINIIRTTWGLANYQGASDLNSLIDEILFQRRYSLWAEGGHRWIDMRRYDKLNEIPVESDGTIFTQIAPPQSETKWDESQGG